MKIDDLITRSIFIIHEYYDNNLEPFFESISDDVLWIGPAERQYIRGKKELLEAFANEQHSLTFTMSDIRAMYLSAHSHVKEIVLHYEVCTHYPSGNTITHDQRLHFTWREKRNRSAEGRSWEAEIAMVHISNAWKYDPSDTIYPVHYESLSTPLPIPAKPEQFVLLKALDGSVYRIAIEHIIYIETVKRSARLLVHTKNGPITINGTLPAFLEKYPDEFVRIHASYLINPAAMREIRRFSVTLADGTTLPIPEKKYTQIKKRLLQEDAG